MIGMRAFQKKKQLELIWTLGTKICLFVSLAVYPKEGFVECLKE